MAKGHSSPFSDRHPSSTFSLFIDTNLDTHLAIVVSPNDTVADLKGKIMTEHALCFPNIGVVSVKALKVKRKASFYHLSDSMLVKSAFIGIKGTWFLNLDLEPTTSIVKTQTETAGVILSETNGKPAKHNILEIDHNASLLPVSGDDRPQDFVANGVTIEKGLIQTSIANVHERETLSYTRLLKQADQRDSLLPNVCNPRTKNLHVSSNDMLVSGGNTVDGSIFLKIAQNDLKDNSDLSRSEVDRRPDPALPEMELVTEGDAVVESNRKKKTEQAADQGNEGKGEDHGNVGVGSDVDVPVVASKKEKTRKRNGSLENDQFSDGKSEHPYLEKKRRMKEKDQPLKEHVKDQLTRDNLENSFYSKEMSRLEKVLLENSFQEKHETNLVTSEGFPSKPSHVDSSLQQTSIDDKQKKKKKKKKRSSKHEKPPHDEAVDNLLRNTNVSLGKQVAKENHLEQLANNHTDLEKESVTEDLIEGSDQKVTDGASAKLCMTDPLSAKHKQSDYTTEKLFVTQEVSIPEGPRHNKATALDNESNDTNICKEAEQSSNHAEVDPEVAANSCRSKKKSKIDTSSKNEALGSSVKPVNKENIDHTSGNIHDKLSKVSGVAMTDADLGNKNATKSGTPSEISVESSRHSRKKKREKTELSNTQSATLEIVNSSRDKVLEENQNKMSGTPLEHPGKKFKGAAVAGDASAAGNSAVVESTFPSSPNDKKQKRRHQKSEKIELHHQDSNMQSSTHETINTSRDQVMEEFSKETSIELLECPGKESKEATVLEEAVENSISAQVIVPSNPNDKESKRSRKKSEKTAPPSGESIRTESVHSLVDKVTEENLKESLKDDQTGTSGSHHEHPGKESEEVAVFGEAAVIANPSTVPLSPSDKKPKRKRKKSGKTELPRKDSSKDEASHSLVKEAAKVNPGETLDGSSTGIGESSKSATTLGEAAGPESTAELGSVITSSTNGRNLSHQDKRNYSSGLIDHSSSNYDHDRSLASDHTHENLEKESGTTSKSSGCEFNAGTDETCQNMDHVNSSNLDTSGLDDSSDKNETGHLSAKNATKENTVGLQKAHEESDMETVKDTIHKGSTEFIEAKDHREPKSDSGKIDSKIFDPKTKVLELAQELPSVETETRKTNKGKTKRKNKLNPSPQDSTASLLKPSVSDKQHILPKKHQDNDSGNHSLSDPVVHVAAELLPSKKNKKKDANKTHKSDVPHPDTSNDVGPPRRSNDDGRPGKKTQNYESNTHFQVPLSADESNRSNGKNSMSTGSKLQSLTNNEGNKIMVSASEVPKHKNIDSSVRSSPGGAPVTQNSSNAVANVPAEEDMDYLAPSSDNTEEDTPFIKKRYRVAVRKVPSNRLKVSNKFNEEKTSLAASRTIFNDATSGSSEDEFEVSNRQAPIKATSDSSSTSADSDEDIEETQISYKNSPGAEAESTDYHKGDKGIHGARSNMTQTPNVKRKGKPLSMILKSTSSYKKAKLTASQSELEDSERLPETQPELGFL